MRADNTAIHLAGAVTVLSPAFPGQPLVAADEKNERRTVDAAADQFAAIAEDQNIRFYHCPVVTVQLDVYRGKKRHTFSAGFSDIMVPYGRII